MMKEKLEINSIVDYETYLLDKFYPFGNNVGTLWEMIIETESKGKYIGLLVTGTLGVLIKAKQEGHIEALKPILHQMIEHGIYISNSLVELCLKQVGEE